MHGCLALLSIHISSRLLYSFSIYSICSRPKPLHLFSPPPLRRRKLEATRDLILENARRIILLANRLQLLHIRAPVARNGLLRLVRVV
jgi:hypothetical protein